MIRKELNVVYEKSGPHGTFLIAKTKRKKEYKIFIESDNDSELLEFKLFGLDSYNDLAKAVNVVMSVSN